jgi:tetratricopeptide (TPR) repeat protein
MFDQNENDEAFDITELLEQYQSAIRNNTPIFLDEDSLEILIDHYEFMGDYSNAHQLCNIGIENHAFSSVFYLRKATLFLEQQELEKAEDLIEKATLFNPNDIEIVFSNAQLLVAKGLHDEAIALIKNKLKDHIPAEEKSDLMLEIAAIYEDKEQFDKMFDALKSALIFDYNNEEAYHRIWLCTEMTEKYEESIKLHEQIINESPYSFLAWYNLGHAYYGLEKYEKAIEAYEYVQAIDDQNDYILKDIGEVYFKIKRIDKAIETFSEYLQNNKEDEEIYYNLGMCFEEDKNYVKARQNYEKATRIDNSYDEAFFRIGECYAKQSKWQNAINYYKKAIKINEHRGDYYVALAKSCIQTNDLESALLYFNDAVQQQPRRLESWIEYINTLYDLGTYEFAMQTIDAALNILPDAYELRLVQSCILLEEKRIDEAYQNLSFLCERKLINSDTIEELCVFFEDETAIQEMLFAVKKEFNL